MTIRKIVIANVISYIVIGALNEVSKIIFAESRKNDGVLWQTYVEMRQRQAQPPEEALNHKYDWEEK